MAKLVIEVEAPTIPCARVGCGSPEAMMIPGLIECSGPADARVYVSRNVELPPGWQAMTVDGAFRALCPSCVATLFQSATP